MDKRGFLSSGRYSEPDLPQVVYVYKICADTLIGRRDSSASTVSVDEVFAQGAAANDSNTTSLDFIHPILDDQGLRSASFTAGVVVSSQSVLSERQMGSGRKKASSSKRLHKSGIETEEDTASVSSTSSHVSLESPSPDSEPQDEQQVTAKGMRRTDNVSTGAGTKGGRQFHIIPSYNNPSS